MRFSRLVGAVMVAALVLAGLGGCTPSGSGGGSASRVLRVGVSAPIDSLNPFVSGSDYSAVVYQYVYPHLVEYQTSSLTVVPSFASSWTTSTDGKQWTFLTKPGQKWSDGEPLTAKDAAFTMSMILKYSDGPTGLMAGTVNHLKSAKALDDTTLVLTYDAAVANVLPQLTQLHILPEHIWGTFATGDGKKITSFQNGAPLVSGGPFQLTQYKKNQLALFQLNPQWTGTKPWITGFGIQMFANDDAMVTAMKTGQVDYIGESTPATAVETLKAAKVTVDTYPGTTLYDFIINTNPKKTAHRELLNPKVREAFEYAMDRAQMVQTAWLGHGTSGSTIVAPGSGWHDDAVQALPFDLAKAGQILDALGYTKGPDGVRVADGVKMAYDVIFPTEINGAGDRMFQIIQNDFTQLGVKLSMRKMDTDAATAAITGEDGKYTGFDLAMWDWVPPVDPDFILSAITCGQLGNNSDSGFCDKHYDGLYDAQGVALSEQARRKLVNEAQAYAFEQRPYIVLTYPDLIEAHSAAWSGFIASPLVGSINNLSTETLLAVHQ